MAQQVAGEMYHDLDGQLFEIKRQLRQLNGYPYDPGQLKVALQNVIEGRFGDVRAQEVIPTKPTPLFSVIATTNLGATGGKKTSKCFAASSRYYHRDADFDNWLPASQPKADVCVISTLGFTKDWTFIEAAAKVLGLGTGTSIQMLGKALIENGHTMTLVQAEGMVEATERGDNTGMRTDGYGNFAFVETGDPENPVSVARVSRDDPRWIAFVLRLDRGFRWNADSRLLVRNLDALKL